MYVINISNIICTVFRVAGPPPTPVYYILHTIKLYVLFTRYTAPYTLYIAHYVLFMPRIAYIYIYMLYTRYTLNTHTHTYIYIRQMPGFCPDPQ